MGQFEGEEYGAESVSEQSEIAWSGSNSSSNSSGHANSFSPLSSYGNVGPVEGLLGCAGPATLCNLAPTHLQQRSGVPGLLMQPQQSQQQQQQQQQHQMMSSTGSSSCEGSSPGSPQPSGPTISMQSKCLKQINSYNTKEALLTYVANYASVLDEINLTTCIYRLARMYNGISNPTARRQWNIELRASGSFQTLLQTVKSHLIQQHLKLLQQGRYKGFDARCVSNLIWALVKLEVATEQGSVCYDVVQLASVFVLHCLSSSSCQGLANLLWAFSKMAEPQLAVMMKIVAEMTVRLMTAAYNGAFDAQALSNSIWALAHVKSKVSDLDAVAGMPGLTVCFMIGVASSAMMRLKDLNTCADLPYMQQSMIESERQFSCQALVNICWSFASLLGEDVNKIPAVQTLFSCICNEALIRLRATATALQLNQQWILRLKGGFNEQALSNIVYAFDKAKLLSPALLQAAFAVAALRLDKAWSHQSSSFKPQELCTLLRAAQTAIAQPWAFLEKLQSTLMASPHILRDWSAAERAEVDRSMALLDMYHTATLLQRINLENQDLAVHRHTAQQNQHQQHQQTAFF